MNTSLCFQLGPPKTQQRHLSPVRLQNSQLQPHLLQTLLRSPAKATPQEACSWYGLFPDVSLCLSFIKCHEWHFDDVSLKGLDKNTLSNLLPEQLLADILSERLQVI